MAQPRSAPPFALLRILSPVTVTATANDVFYIVDLGGVLANGLLGGTLARTMRMDPAGFVVLAIISGLGGVAFCATSRCSRVFRRR